MGKGEGGGGQIIISIEFQYTIHFGKNPRNGGRPLMTGRGGGGVIIIRREEVTHP